MHNLAEFHFTNCYIENSQSAIFSQVQMRHCIKTEQLSYPIHRELQGVGIKKQQ